MSWEAVQALVLRPAHASNVVHLMLRVAPVKGGQARQLLQDALAEAPLTIGDAVPAKGLHCTLGFTYRGLEALGMPVEYRRIFWRLAPAFTQGAPLRATRLGDSGASAPARWTPGFALDNAHVLITLHSSKEEVERLEKLVAKWTARWDDDGALACVEVLRGARLGAPDRKKESGEWVHFGFRDGLVDHHIDGVKRALSAGHAKSKLPEALAHAPGEFLLGHRNNNGSNAFNLPLAPPEVRDFFHDSSFGVLRPMRQDVHAFQQAVRRWQAEARKVLKRDVSAAWVKAKVCGRWPSGEAVRPGQFEVQPGDMQLDFEKDPAGTGCPLFSHVRRMDARGHAGTVQRERTLLRRGMPFGPENWDGNDDGKPRGLHGLFFCASLEDQFEQLLGQWANGSPPGDSAGNLASDPLAGHHDDGRAPAFVPLATGETLEFTGFQPWTQTQGTVFTWHPGGSAAHRILGDDYLPEEKDGMWL